MRGIGVLAFRKRTRNRLTIQKLTVNSLTSEPHGAQNIVAGSHASLPAIELREVSNTLIAVLPYARMDVGNVQDVCDAILTGVREHPQVVLDLSGVAYVDIIGFDGLLEAVRRCQGDVRFACSEQGPRVLFQLSQLSWHHILYESVEQALASFS